MSTAQSHPFRRPLILLLVAGLGLLGLLAGCSNSVSGGTQGIVTGEPAPDPTRPRAISGVVYALAPAQDVEGNVGTFIDVAFGATVTVTGTPDGQTAFTPQTTLTTTGGSYLFSNIPPGTYTVTASITNEHQTLAAAPVQVRVENTMPTAMVNFLLGPDDAMATITGTIDCVNGYQPDSATVTLAVQAPNALALQGYFGSETETALLLSSTVQLVNGAGQFTLSVPVGATDYYVDVQSATSERIEYTVTGLVAGGTHEISTPFTLQPGANNPDYPNLQLYNTSITLPRPTQQAYQQTLVTRLAVARASDASPEEMARLEAMAARSATTRTAAAPAVSIVVNDLYWPLEENEPRDTSVLGYHIYRAASTTDTFERVGTLNDLYHAFFVDMDPSELTIGRTMYYTVASFGPNGRSPLSRVVISAPLEQITPTMTPEHVIQWTAVPNARSYFVTVYPEQPNFNNIPIKDSPFPVAGSATSYDLSALGLEAGTYYWTVSAYNAESPRNATAETHAEYQQVTLP